MDQKLFKSKQGIRLDLGCSDHKQPGFVGMDIRKCEGVDIVHDIQKFPWPVPTDSCFQVLMSHLWEHIEPKYRVMVMDELWRIVKPTGQLMLAAPYANSFGAMQDPTHYTAPNEATFTYFDPDCELYKVYKPKPWKLERNTWRINGCIEVILSPRKDRNRVVRKTKPKR